MTDDGMIEFFFNPKKAKAIVCIRRNSREGLCVSDVSRKIDTTYAHSCKIVTEMVDKNLAEKEKKGRRKELTLTEHGQEIADTLNEVFNLVEKQPNVMTSQSQSSEAPEYLTQGGVVSS